MESETDTKLHTAEKVSKIPVEALLSRAVRCLSTWSKPSTSIPHLDWSGCFPEPSGTIPSMALDSYVGAGRSVSRLVLFACVPSCRRYPCLVCVHPRRRAGGILFPVGREEEKREERELVVYLIAPWRSMMRLEKWFFGFMVSKTINIYCFALGTAQSVETS